MPSAAKRLRHPERAYYNEAAGSRRAEGVSPRRNFAFRFNTLEYDFNGNRTKLTDQSGRVVAWEYDGLNRQTKQTRDPGGLALVTTTAYDVTPGVIGQTSTVTSPAGQVVTTLVDGLGRSSTVSGDTVKMAYAYDVVTAAFLAYKDSSCMSPCIPRRKRGDSQSQ